MSNETNATIDEIMRAADELAQAKTRYANLPSSLLAGNVARKETALRHAITSALNSQARQIEALMSERDDLRNQLDAQTAPAPGEWVEWHGGAQPVQDGVLCSIRLEGGEEGVRYAEDWSWEHDEFGSNIVAYRIIPDRSLLV